MDILELNKSSILQRATEYGSCMILAKEYEVPYIKMWKFLKKNGVEFQQVKLSPEIEKSLVADYQSGLASKELGKKYGIAQASVCNYMRRLGIEPHGPRRAKTINHDFFKTLNEDACWILGWFYTDGNVNKKTNHFSVTVQKQDEPLLHLINKIMGVDKESVYHPKNGGAPSLFGCDESVHSDLVRLGCMPRKSLIVQYPTAFTEDWQHWAFLRGVLEGDGSIGFKSKGNRPGFNCEIASGSLPFLTSIQNLLKEKLNIDCGYEIKKKQTRKINGKDAHFSVGYKLMILGGRESIMRFLDLLYKNGTTEHYLERKFAIYLKMKENMTRPPAYDHVNRDKYCEGYFLSPDGKVYHVIGLKKFSREIGLGVDLLCHMLKPRTTPYKSRKSGWGPATSDQISAARESGTLIEKHY